MRQAPGTRRRHRHPAQTRQLVLGNRSIEGYRLSTGTLGILRLQQRNRPSSNRQETAVSASIFRRPDDTVASAFEARPENAGR